MQSIIVTAAVITMIAVVLMTDVSDDVNEYDDAVCTLVVVAPVTGLQEHYCQQQRLMAAVTARHGHSPGRGCASPKSAPAIGPDHSRHSKLTILSTPVLDSLHPSETFFPYPHPRPSPMQHDP